MIRARSLLVPAAFALAMACSETVAPPPPAPVDWASFSRATVDAGTTGRATEKERLIARQYAQAFASDGFRALAPLLAEEAHVSFGQRSALGRDRVVAMHQTIFGAFDQRTLAPARVFVTDSEQAIEWVFSGVQAREWMGVAPTQKRIATTGVSVVWTKDDGSISDIHIYFDENVVKGQLGVGPAELQSLPPAQLPSGPPQIVERAGTDQETANLGSLREMIDALEENKEAVYLSHVEENASLSTPDRAAPVLGKDAWRNYFQSMRRSVGQLDTLAQGGFGAGDWAILEYSISGVQVAPFERVPFVRGRAMRMHVVDVAELHGGKVTRMLRYDDPAEIAPSP